MPIIYIPTTWAFFIFFFIHIKLEQIRGFEPLPSRWQRDMLPLTPYLLGAGVEGLNLQLQSGPLMCYQLHHSCLFIVTVFLCKSCYTVFTIVINRFISFMVTFAKVTYRTSVAFAFFSFWSLVIWIPYS